MRQGLGMPNLGLRHLQAHRHSQIAYDAPKERPQRSTCDIQSAAYVSAVGERNRPWLSWPQPLHSTCPAGGSEPTHPAAVKRVAWCRILPNFTEDCGKSDGCDWKVGMRNTTKIHN